MSAGKQGSTTVFLLTDTQIKEEAFLEDVDGLLNAGEVANLFPLDEKQDILEVRYSVVTVAEPIEHVGWRRDDAAYSLRNRTVRVM